MMIVKNNKKVKNSDDNDNDNGDDNTKNTTNWLSIIGNQNKILRWRVMIVSLLLLVVLTFWATCFLPYNNIALLTTYRTIIPPNECNQLIQAAEDYVAAAAVAAGEDEQRNIMKGVNNTNTNDNRNSSSNSNEDSDGTSSNSEWLTERHSYYATTDLSLFSIPKATQLWKSKIQDKVLPVVAAQYDCPIDDLELVDLFIVKYTGGGGIDGQQQDSLDLHMDGSMISFNIALSEYNDNNDNDKPIINDDSNSYYTGGGTFVPLLNNTDNNNNNNNKTTTTTTGLVRIHQGDMLVHDSGLLHSGAQTRSGKRYLLVGFVNLRSWKNVPYYLQYRHFGTTATCVNVSSSTVVVEQKEDNNDGYKYENNKYKNEYEIVCPGTRTARKILIQHYTRNFINFDDPDDPTSLPNPLLIYGVTVHIFILLRVLFIMCRPTPTIPKLNK